MQNRYWLPAGSYPISLNNLILLPHHLIQSQMIIIYSVISHHFKGDSGFSNRSRTILRSHHQEIFSLCSAKRAKSHHSNFLCSAIAAQRVVSWTQCRALPSLLLTFCPGTSANGFPIPSKDIHYRSLQVSCASLHTTSLLLSCRHPDSWFSAG